MKIRTKLILGCIGIAVLAAAVCITAFRMPGIVERPFDELTQETLPLIETLGDLRFAGLRIVSSASELALERNLKKNPDNRYISAVAGHGAEDLFSSGEEMYLNALSRFEKLAAEFPHEQDYYKKIKAEGGLLIENSRSFMRSLRGNRSASELLALKEEFTQSEQSFFELLDEVTHSEQKEIADRSSTLRRTLLSAKRSLLTVGIVAFLISLILTILTASSIAWPLRRLREKIERLGNGGLAVRAEVKSGDEIGVLSESFNRMADSLSSAYASLEEKREFFSTVINSLDDAVSIVDPATMEIIEANSAFLKMTGRKRDRVIDRKCYEVIHGKEEPCPMACAVNQMYSEGMSVTTEYEHDNISGQKCHFEVTASPIKDRDGKVIQAVYVARDVTTKVEQQKSMINSQNTLIQEHDDLRRLYKEMKLSKKEWEKTMDCVGDMVILTDSDGMIKKFNRAFSEFASSGEDELTNMSWEEAISARDLETRTFYQGSIELYHIPSNRWFAMNVYPFEDVDADFFGSVITIHETTEIKEITEELEKTNRKVEQNRIKLQRALDEIFRLIEGATKELSLGIRFRNPYIRKCYEVKDCKKKDCPCFGKEEMRCWQVAGTYCGGKVQGAFAQKYGSCSKCNVYKDATSDPIYQIGEQFNNMMHVLEIKNIELEEAYRELQSSQSTIVQQEKMASIGQLAAGVAHEINNPMGFISSNLGTLGKYLRKLSEFIEAQGDAAEDVASGEVKALLDEKRKSLKVDYILEDVNALIEESLEGADRVKKIVQNLKSFSRVDETEYKTADINECIESTLNIVWNELKYKAEVKKEYGDIPVTKCYPQQLNQVFMNLLVNGAQSMEQQGEIRIRTWNGDGFVKISISDTGCGIPEDKVERIFEPFYTTKPVGKGTGLGLSISYEIIKKHRGDIEVESEVGRGTTFTIKIPVIQEGEDG